MRAANDQWPIYVLIERIPLIPILRFRLRFSFPYTSARKAKVMERSFSLSLYLQGKCRPRRERRAKIYIENMRNHEDQAGKEASNQVEINQFQSTWSIIGSTKLFLAWSKSIQSNPIRSSSIQFYSIPFGSILWGPHLNSSLQFKSNSSMRGAAGPIEGLVKTLGP